MVRDSRGARPNDNDAATDGAQCPLEVLQAEITESLITGLRLVGGRRSAHPTRVFTRRDCRAESIGRRDK